MADQTGTGQPIGTLLTPRGESLVLTMTNGGTTTVGRYVQITAWDTGTNKPSCIVPAATLQRSSTPLAGIALQSATTTVAVSICVQGGVAAEIGAALTIGKWCGTDSSGRVVNLTLGTVSGATTVTADAVSATVEGFIGLGIVYLLVAGGSAGDGAGILLAR